MKCQKKVIGIIEKLLQNYFNSLGFHIEYDGGTEFYKRDIIHLIVPYLEKTNIQFKVLSKQEVEYLVRCNHIREILNKKSKHLFK